MSVKHHLSAVAGTAGCSAPVNTARFCRTGKYLQWRGGRKLRLKMLSNVNSVVQSMGSVMVVGLAALFVWVLGMDRDGGRALSLTCGD